MSVINGAIFRCDIFIAWHSILKTLDYLYCRILFDLYWRIIRASATGWNQILFRIMKSLYRRHMALFEGGRICQLFDARKIKKRFSFSLTPFATNLVHFTTQVPDTSSMSATWVRHECDTIDTSVKQVLHEWKVLILITTRVKTHL